MTRGFGGADDRRQINTTTQPIRTAMEVVKIMTNSRFSSMTEVTWAPEKSAEALEGSILPLMIAAIRSNGEIFMELDEESI